MPSASRSKTKTPFMADSRFEAATALAPLKAFQRRTVDYVFDRLYADQDSVRQFLVADEVGLGKTMVARGVIARTIEKLWDTSERIDILYICSNQAIAAQNLNRLNVLNRRELALPTHGRYPYSAITERADYAWPGGKRLAVYFAINLEHFAFGEGMGAKLGGFFGEPDVLNYSWRDYGNRVGVWRMLELFDALSLPMAVLANASIYRYCPGVMAAFRDRKAEVVAHGRTTRPQAQRLQTRADR